MDAQLIRAAVVSGGLILLLILIAVAGPQFAGAPTGGSNRDAMPFKDQSQ